MSATLSSSKLRRSLSLGGKSYTFYSLKAAEEAGLDRISKLPFTLKILLENLLRHLDGKQVQEKDIIAFNDWVKTRSSNQEISFYPARVLMQDFTGVPAIVDLAAMRDAVAALKKDPTIVNPLSCVDLVIDHSVMVDSFGNSAAYEENVKREYQRNRERYAFLRWGQQAFKNFRVVPPGTGICHQVNLEYLAQVIWTEEKDGEVIAFPDTLVGTDSHTTMVNGLAILGWGVGGIEAEAAMLGQALSMVLPEVVGVKLTGFLKEGITATDLVLTITQLLRATGVVGKFVEFFGEGIESLSLADRATIANMAPEYGATCGFFPIDEETLAYLRLTGRNEERIQLVEAYAKEQSLWHYKDQEDPVFTQVITVDIGQVERSVSGPKRPQDRLSLSVVAATYRKTLSQEEEDITKTSNITGTPHQLHHGDIVIAAITSCTNTSNPAVMIGAGLLAKNAVKKGLKVKPWVKTSLAPGSQVVSDYLEKAGLQSYLDTAGFNLVGYGCTTCIGNSGPLPEPIAQAIADADLNVCSVLSGNRNFEGRIHPLVRSNYLASPMLVVAYALAGSILHDFEVTPLGEDEQGKPLYLRDIWPSNEDIKSLLNQTVTPDLFIRRYQDVFKGDQEWQSITVPLSQTYAWQQESSYVKAPPYFTPEMLKESGYGNILEARPLAILGDSITTDHISPAGSIKADSPAGYYLRQQGVEVSEFNSYGARRGNHEVMIRGTFANIRLKNEMVPGVSGGMTKIMPEGMVTTLYEASQFYQKAGTPLIIIAGKEYGTGSSRDWAAKGTRLLGVRAVIAESFERIHRSNLVGMGVLPLAFLPGVTRQSLGITGAETFTLTGLEHITPKMEVTCTLHSPSGVKQTISLLCRIDTEEEVNYFLAGGILPFVMEQLIV